jgi:hypothetical protein
MPKDERLRKDEHEQENYEFGRMRPGTHRRGLPGWWKAGRQCTCDARRFGDVIMSAGRYYHFRCTNCGDTIRHIE